MQTKHEKIIIFKVPFLNIELAIACQLSNHTTLKVNKYVEVNEEEFDDIRIAAKICEQTEDSIPFLLAIIKFVITDKKDHNSLTGMIEFVKSTDKYHQFKYEHNLN